MYVFVGVSEKTHGYRSAGVFIGVSDRTCTVYCVVKEKSTCTVNSSIN